MRRTWKATDTKTMGCHKDGVILGFYWDYIGIMENKRGNYKDYRVYGGVYIGVYIRVI